MNKMTTRLIGPIIVCMMMISITGCVSTRENSFIPTDFEVPKKSENEHFRIRQLMVKDAEKDYDAITSSLDHLQKMFLSEWDWPPSDLTLEDDRIELGKEEERFKKRTSFAYTVVSLDESQVLGCVYIYPANKGGYDADITMWVRKSAFDKGLDPILFDSVRQWIKKEWPFDNPGYPGRDINWKDWNELN